MKVLLKLLTSCVCTLIDMWTDGRMLWSSYATNLVADIDCTPLQLLSDATLPKLFNISGNNFIHSALHTI